MGCGRANAGGRYPATVLHDGSDYALDILGENQKLFYCTKADRDDRAGSRHPSVKPLDLLSWLVALTVPEGGTVLDPFAGSGTTGQAALELGFRAILVEREAEYVEDIRRRLADYREF